MRKNRSEKNVEQRRWNADKWAMQQAHKPTNDRNEQKRTYFRAFFFFWILKMRWDRICASACARQHIRNLVNLFLICFWLRFECNLRAHKVKSEITALSASTQSKITGRNKMNKKPKIAVENLCLALGDRQISCEKSDEVKLQTIAIEMQNKKNDKLQVKKTKVEMEKKRLCIYFLALSHSGDVRA